MRRRVCVSSILASPPSRPVTLGLAFHICRVVVTCACLAEAESSHLPTFLAVSTRYVCPQVCVCVCVPRNGAHLSDRSQPDLNWSSTCPRQTIQKKHSVTISCKERRWNSGPLLWLVDRLQLKEA